MLAIKNAEESEPVNHNAIAQCKILLAEHMYEATMLWGDIPFTESWNGTIKYPKFDSQESVLNGVLSLLDERTIWYFLTLQIRVTRTLNMNL